MDIPIQGIYKHHKGSICTVICEAEHTETGEIFVIYKEGENFWARPRESFLKKVKKDGKMINRFEKIS